MTNSTQSIDFEQVEALRNHMSLSKSDMAELITVSRQTYYSWVKGAKVTKANDKKVRIVLRKMLSIIKDHGWPTPVELALDPKERKAKLLALYEEY